MNSWKLSVLLFNVAIGRSCDKKGEVGEAFRKLQLIVIDQQALRE
jgi:hypothetical protein